MGSVSVVTTVKWFWFLLSLAALAGVIVALARSFKEASIQRYPEVNAFLALVGYAAQGQHLRQPSVVTAVQRACAVAPSNSSNPKILRQCANSEEQGLLAVPCVCRLMKWR
jgi:hypothetical protein